MRMLRLPTAGEDYVYMLPQDYASHVQKQHNVMQVSIMSNGKPAPDRYRLLMIGCSALVGMQPRHGTVTMK